MNHENNRKCARFNHRVVLVLPCLLALTICTIVGATTTTTQKTFPTPKAAADALINAAEKFDVPTLEAILGPDGKDIIHTGEPARDAEIAKDFAKQAREKMEVSIDKKTKRSAFISVGNDNWPFPVPIVKTGSMWSFDSKSGLNEILRRRVGRNELD